MDDSDAIQCMIICITGRDMCLVIVFVGAKASAEGVVELRCDEVDMTNYKTASDCINAATNPELVAQLEGVVTTWCKQVVQVCLMCQLFFLVCNA